ncbi:MAG: hypothetical protein AMXMBFR84_46720 [Candidatus Hydrogenedentota bacterium]
MENEVNDSIPDLESVDALKARIAELELHQIQSEALMSQLQKTQLEEKRFSDSLTVLIDVSNELATARSKDDLCREAVRLARTKLGFERIGIWFVAKEPNCVKGSFGVDDDGNVRDERGWRMHIPPESPEARVLRCNDSIVFIGETRATHGYRIDDTSGKQALAPLRDGDTVVGYISMDNQLTGRPIVWQQCELFRLFASAIGHVWARIRTLKALMESEDRYRTVAEFSSDFTYWMDPDSKMRYVSPACFDVTGYTAEEFYESPRLLDSIVHPDDRLTWHNHHDAVFANSHGNSVHIRIVRKDGETRWISHVCRSVRDAEGAFVGTRGSHRDVTAQKKADLEREKLIAELRAAMTKVRTLGGLLPICANCKKIRNDEGYWTQIEEYIREHSEAEFSHGLCPECMDHLYPEVKHKMHQESGAAGAPAQELVKRA